jgi:hypothetical protein
MLFNFLKIYIYIFYYLDINGFQTKYGFYFNWFLNSYNKINYPESYLKFNQNTREFIENIYNIHYTNYDGFLDEVYLHLNQKEKKQEFLKYEKNALNVNVFIHTN